MTELLLNSVETLNFCNLKASWRSKKINSEINTLTNEIKKAISEGDTIFKGNNAPVNFIEELVNLDEQLLSSNTDEKEKLILKRDRIASQLSEFITGLPLNTREDLEFIIKQITDRQDRIASLKETLAAIKEAYPESKVVMVTAAGQKNKMVEAVQSGADEFIPKPFDAEQLVATLTKVLGA